MIYRFTFKGFQSIRKPVTVEVNGFTVVEGKSHIGKSSMIRCIRAAFCNQSGTDFLTVDGDGCEFVAEGNNHCVKWFKTDKSTSYEVDGKKINKPGRVSFIEEVGVFGIQPIRTLDKSLHWPQIQLQDEGNFILAPHYTDTTAAELLGASADTAIVVRAIQLANGDVSKAVTRTEVLESQLKSIDSNVAQVEDLVKELGDVQNEVNSKEVIWTALEEKNNQIKKFLATYRRFWVQWKVTNSLIKLPIPLPPNPSTFETLRGLQNRYNSLLDVIERAKHGHEAIPSVPEARNRFIQLQSSYIKAASLSARIRVMAPVVTKETNTRPDFSKHFQRIELLTRLKRDFIRTQREVESSDREAAEINAKLRDIDKELKGIHRLVDDLEVCPLCSAPMHNGKFSETGVL
jgi:DNA repair ATPase RecN